MTEPDLFVGLDVGTTAVKAALFDANGHVVAEAIRPYPTLVRRRGSSSRIRATGQTASSQEWTRS